MAPKIAWARWFGFFDTLAFWLKVWHARLITLTYVCISLDLLATPKSADIMKYKVPIDIEKADEKNEDGA